MQLFPTRPAVQVALAGVAALGAGIVLREPAILAWGGAIVMGVAVARAVTLVSIARIRAAGFEMLWSGPKRVERLTRGGEIELDAEVRNRDSRSARFVELRAVASGNLEIALEPRSGEVPAGGSLAIKLKIRAPRVGQHGLHGLSLEVRGQPGLFEVPLTFANPFGLEVLPRPFAPMFQSARGGRARMGADAGRPGPLAGEGTELRELREHVPGDPFKRIAWRASARRGQLLVRDFEREERDVVWLVLDASVELLAGPVGKAPLDAGVDEIAALAQRHLSRGDRVGLAVVAARPRAFLAPDRGPSQSSRIATALALSVGAIDFDRSDLDEADVAARVYEHLQSIDPRAVARLNRRDLDGLAERAEAVRAKGPFVPGVPAAPTLREKTLRHYLASFGIDSPPRIEPDRPKTDVAIVQMLERIALSKPRPSIVHVWSPAPESSSDALALAVRKLSRRGIRLEWICARHEPAIQLGDGAAARVVADAVMVRAKVARLRGEKVLRSLGVRVARAR